MTETMIFAMAGEREAREHLHYRSCGLDNVYLANGFRQKKHGNEIYTSVKNVEALHSVITFRLAVLRRPLSGKELTFLRKNLGPTQQELADYLDLSRQQVIRYEHGDSPISRPVQRMIQMRFLAEYLREIIPLAKGGIAERIKIRDQILQALDWLAFVDKEMMGEAEVPPFHIDAGKDNWHYCAAA